jgi:hypothetical protein
MEHLRRSVAAALAEGTAEELATVLFSISQLSTPNNSEADHDFPQPVGFAYEDDLEN